MIFRRRADEDFGKYEKAFRTVSPSYKGAFRSWLKRISFLIRISDGSEIMKVSRDPTVRCLECGWRYEFNLATKCPVCSSDRARLLTAEDPYSKPWNIVFYTLISIAIWAYGIIYFRT
jgi:predicted Zn-ribbon and HTH transcriptional regulator